MSEAQDLIEQLDGINEQIKDLKDEIEYAEGLRDQIIGELESIGFDWESV